MFGFLGILLTTILGFGAGAAGLLKSANTTSPNTTSYSSVGACYLLESQEIIALPASKLPNPACQNILGNKDFVRIRRGLKMINEKTDEFRGSSGTCEINESVRQIATLDDGRVIYWVPANFEGNDISNIILVLLKKDSIYHYFDVYIDQKATDPLPDFIVNCKETGGLVPVLENPATPSFPPQTISLSDSAEGRNFNQLSNQFFDINNFGVNYASFAGQLKDKYFLRIEEITDENIPKEAKQVGILRKSIKEETRNYDAFFHGGIVYLKGEKELKNWMYNPTEDKPPLDTGQHASSLQLAAMHFTTTSEWTWSTPSCKPALYFYPQKPINLNVKLDLNGELTVSNPIYDPKTGWDIKAYPTGNLSTSANNHQPSINYPYLYYEANLYGVDLPKEGFVYSREELPKSLKALMTTIGFNDKEISDFLSYWLPRLTDKPYYFVSLLPENVINQKEKLTFSVTPDTLIRSRFVFEGLDAPISVAPLTNIQTHSRNGFTVTDWGGTLVGKSCSNVTVK